MVYRLFQTAYEQTVRPLLPKKIGMHAGVAIRRPRLFDFHDHFPDHNKRKLSRFCWEAIDRGDDVVVGGGQGISTVLAAQATGPSGSVTIYEAAENLAKKLRETMHLNGVHEWTTVNHAIVGEARVDTDGIGNPEQIDPSNLPYCDSLQIDCEGSEISILKQFTCYPATLVVETHPRYGSRTDQF